jgi:hypothetical protein
MLMTGNGVWIDYWLHWTLTTHNYNTVTNLYALEITTAHSKSSQFIMSELGTARLQLIAMEISCGQLQTMLLAQSQN